MPRTSHAWRSLLVFLTAGLIVLAGPHSSKAQTTPPDMPTNLLSPAVPYQQGIANIEAQGAARPQATQPVLPTADTQKTNQPAPSILNRPAAPNSPQAPTPRQ